MRRNANGGDALTLAQPPVIASLSERDFADQRSAHALHAARLSNRYHGGFREFCF
jgi:hypothetical protein